MYKFIFKTELIWCDDYDDAFDEQDIPLHDVGQYNVPEELKQVFERFYKNTHRFIVSSSREIVENTEISDDTEFRFDLDDEEYINDAACDSWYDDEEGEIHQDYVYVFYFKTDIDHNSKEWKEFWEDINACEECTDFKWKVI